MIETAPVSKIYKQMILVMRDVGAIGKEQRNTQQGYAFRGIDDVYNHLQSKMAEHGVFCVPEVLTERYEDRVTSKGNPLIYRILTIRYRFYADDGSGVSCITIGEGMDSGDKASNKAMSVAHKYALLQAFCIPTKDNDDPDKESAELADGSRGAPQRQRSQNSKPPPATNEPPPPEAQKPAKTAPVPFDKENKNHQARLQTLLKKMKVDIALWPQIAEGLHGNPSSEGRVNKILTEMKGKK